MTEISTQSVLRGLTTEFLGRTVAYHARVDSTNNVADALARQGAAEGTLVIADEQTAGRGRLNRRWLAPAGTSLLFSLIFRPELPIQRAHGLTMICGLGVHAAIQEVTGLPVRLKWPNDILIHGRKTGGILSESCVTASRIEYAIVGIGLNVNMAVDALPTELCATSLAHELGDPVPRVALLQHILTHIEERYCALRSGAWPVREWSAALDTLGQRIRVQTGEGLLEGTAESVDDSGALCVRQANGDLRQVVVGDVAASATGSD